jgi:hypothetical protein
MDVVGHAINGDQSTAKVSQNAADKWVKALFQFWSDEIGAVFGAKYRVIEVLRECAGNMRAPSGRG